MLKLSKREKIMLLGLALVLIWMAGYSLLSPQFGRVAALREQKSVLAAEVEKVRAAEGELEAIELQYSELITGVQVTTRQFYPEMFPEKNILLLEDAFARAGILVESLSFSAVQAPELKAPTGSLPDIGMMTFSFSVNADYDRFMGLLRTFEAMDRSIFVNGVEMGPSGGRIEISFYAIGKLQLQADDEDYRAWPFDRAYGKSNPFAASPPA